MGPPLVVAGFQGHAACVRLLLQAGAPVEFVQEHNQVTALWAACQSGRAAAARVLIDASANTNHLAADGTSPLYAACQNGHIAIVKMLLAARARADLILDSGRSPLSVACQRA
eukprot:526356-Prymnesium_polylepis.1